MRWDLIWAIARAVRADAGAAGVDGVTTEAAEPASAAFLDGVQAELRNRSYRPSPVLAG